MKISPGKKARAVKKATADRVGAAARRITAAKKAAAKRKMRRRSTEKQTRAVMDAYSPVRQSSVYGELQKVTLSLDPQTMDILRQVGRGSMSEGARQLTRLVNLDSLKPAASIDVPPAPPSPQVTLFETPAEAIAAGLSRVVP